MLLFFSLIQSVFFIYFFLQVKPAFPSTKRITEELWPITKRLYEQTLAAQVRVHFLRFSASSSFLLLFFFLKTVICYTNYCNLRFKLQC